MSQANYDSHALGCHCNQCMSSNAPNFQALGTDWQKYFAGQSQFQRIGVAKAYQPPPREMTAADLGLVPDITDQWSYSRGAAQ